MYTDQDIANLVTRVQQLELQLASRPRMKAGEFLKGHSLPLGSRLGD